MTKKETKSLAEELAAYDEKIRRLQEQIDNLVQKKNETILRNVTSALEENEAITQFIAEKEQELIDSVKGMNQREQAKYIYKYMVHNYAYDDDLNADLYYLYKNNKGICCSFSLAYYRIMTRLNIPCKMTVNADHTHQWNEVFIDGKWQEVDITEGIRLYNTGFPNAEMRAFQK